ncbi:MAG TPA: serine hydrolase domain-containing protein, partial [Chitinophagaceae bacterium]|nr:serine hydrolase domain-containing protein [Chitinophagaceae bacterium]
MRTSLITGLVLISLWSCQSKGEAAIKKVSDSNQYTAVARPGLDSLEIRKYHDVIESYLNSGLLRWDRFNGSILIAKKGTVVYEKYVGYKDLKTKEPITSTTPLQIASTSKPFTGMAILKLVQEGKLSLETKMEELFPGFPYPGITVKLLLNHRSGLPNYIYYLDKGGWDKKVFLTNADVLQTLMTL